MSIYSGVMCAASRTTSLELLIYIYTRFQLIVKTENESWSGEKERKGGGELE